MTDPLDPLLRHRAAVRRLATRLVGAADADDVVQETYLRAILRPPQGDAMAWLAKIATNVVRFRGRSDARRRARETAIASTRRDREPSTDELLVEIEASERVSQALRALAEPYRTTLVQRYFLGWSNARIARAAGIGEAAVRQRHKRGIDQLRTTLARGSAGRPGLSRSDLRAAFGIPLAFPPPAGLPASPASPAGPLAAAPTAAGSALLASTITMKTTTTFGILGAAILGAGLFGAWHLFRGTAPATAPTGDAPAELRAPIAHGAATESSTGADDTIVRTAARKVDGPDVGADADTATLRIHAVWDDDSSPAADVVVFVRPWGSDVPGIASRFRTTTDAGGRAEIGGLPPGRQFVDGLFRATQRGPVTVVAEAGSTAELELRLERGATVTGRVVDTAGDGIGGAQVVMADWAAQWARPIAVADGDGGFDLPGVAGNPSIGATADGFVASRLRQLTVGERSVQHVELVLERSAASLRVRVVDPFGAPVAGARIATGTLGRQNNPETGVSGAHEIVVPLVHVTDADGRAVLGGLPPGSTPIEVAADGLAGWVGEVDARSAVRGLVEREVQLAADIEVSGTVVDSTGSPIEDVYVEHGRRGHVVHAAGSTDADGRYHLRGLPAGTVAMRAQHKGHDVRTTLPTTPGRALRWDPVFGSAQRLWGVVRLADGAAAAHAGIRAYSTVPPWFGYEHAGEDGSFELGLPSEVRSIRVRVAVHGGFERPVYEGPIPDTELEVVLGPEFEKSAVLRGHLEDGAGAPVVNAKVWYGLDGQGNSHALELDGDGSFRVDVPPGTYRFRIQANGYATGRAIGTVATGERKDLGAIVLEPPASIRVEFDVTGGTAPDQVDLWLTDVERGTRHRLTVRHGVGELGALTEGRYRLQVKGAGIASSIHDVFLDAGRDTPTVVPITAARGVDLAFAISRPDGTATPSPLTLTITDAGGLVVVDHRPTLRADGTLYGDYALAPGTYRVVLSGSELRAEREFVVPRDGTVAVPLQLGR